jgi:MerR family copper efflux transcriptional regulator
MSAKTLFIGEVAQLTGLSVKAIRLYESRGLIRAARQGKYRIYTTREIDVLRLIIEAKALGITLAQLATVIRYDQNEPDWPHIARFLQTIRLQLLAEQTALAQRLVRLDACIAAAEVCPDA